MTEEKLEIIKSKTKRDIFKFESECPTAINLEHVTMLKLMDNKLNFTFQSTGFSVEFETLEIAKSVFDQVVNVWASDVVE